MNRSLVSICGSESGAGVLTFLAEYGEGNCSEIARYLGLHLYAVQTQLAKFAACGLILSQPVGRARVYALDPRHPLHRELKALIEKSMVHAAQARPATPAVRLPAALREFFWDYSFEKLSWEADRDLIIRRLLTHGSWDALAWLRRTLGDTALRRWLIAHQGRGLSPRQIRFWSLALGLPGRQVDAWTGEARLSPWGQR
jgi:hypothetical protein